MKKTTSLFLFLMFAFSLCYAQPGASGFNLDFEITKDNKFPEGWMKWGTSPSFWDSTQANTGKYSGLISIPESAMRGAFGSMAYPLPADYEGQQVTLEGFMKIEDVKDGFAGLLLRVDGEGRTLQFNNMQREQITGTHDWKKYTITLPLPEEADKIYVAGILAGKGKAWFDSFEVFIDDKKIADAKPAVKPVAKADLDTEFDGGSKVDIDKLTDLQQQSLFKLGRVWGFLKYYHPAIATGDYNWDYELFRVLPAVLQAKSANEVNKTLVQWTARFGTLVKRKATTAPEGNVKFKTNLDWLSDKKYLGKELSELLLLVQQQERSDKNYYAGLFPGVRNPQFKHERNYKDFSYTDDGVKLLALYRYWNMIEYFFPYKHLTDKKWDVVLSEYLPKIVDAQDALVYKLTLLELIGEVKDTHANIWQRDQTLEEFWGRKMAVAELKFVEDKVVVTRLLKEEPQLQVGDVITHINNVPVNEVIATKLKHCPASNLSTQYRDVMRKLLRTNESSIKLTVTNESGSSEKTIPVYSMENLDFRQDVPSHKKLENNIGYIYPGSLKRDEIHTIMKDFMDTKGLIIDFRCYPSDFVVFSLGQYLSTPKEFVKFTKGDLKYPGLFSFSEPLKVGSDTTSHYKGKIVIMINEVTQSSAEYHTMALRVAPNATVIGSTTAAADGNVSEIILPGNIRTMISGIGVYYPDGRETQRIGIVPDIEIKPTVAGIRAGRDEMLEKAIVIINQ